MKWLAAAVLGAAIVLMLPAEAWVGLVAGAAWGTAVWHI